MVKSIAWYNRKRRRYKTVANLQSLIAPLTFNSSLNLDTSMTKQFEITSNTHRRHVTLAEGFASSPATSTIVEQIRSVMSRNHTVRVTGVNVVPTTRGHQHLFLLELQFDSAELEAAVSSLHPFCKMPQYPLHCAMGVGSVSNVHPSDVAHKIEQRVWGLELRLNWSLMRELGPPPRPEGDECFQNLERVLLEQQQGRGGDEA